MRPVEKVGDTLSDAFIERIAVPSVDGLCLLLQRSHVKELLFEVAFWRRKAEWEWDDKDDEERLVEWRGGLDDEDDEER